MLPVQRTDRLILRPFRESDFAAVHAFGSDPEVVRFMEWGPHTEADTRDFLRRAVARAASERPPSMEWAVVLEGPDEVIGSCAINDVVTGGMEASVGLCIARPFWGRGIGTEVLHALIETCFGELDLHRVVAACDPENTSSARLLEKLGMRREGHLRECVRVRDEWRDRWVYGLLVHEWRRPHWKATPPAAATSPPAAPGGNGGE